MLNIDSILNGQDERTTIMIKNVTTITTSTMTITTDIDSDNVRGSNDDSSSGDE